MIRKYLFVILILAVFLILGYLKKDSRLIHFGSGPAGFPHPVVRVVDGDTIDVLMDGGRERVRLIGIDAPESVKPGHPVERCGREASEFLKKMLRGKSVRLEYDAELRDRYGRLLAYAYTAGEGESGQVFVNAELVEAGLATTLNIHPNTRFARRFDRFQNAARKKRRGVWGNDDCKPAKN